MVTEALPYSSSFSLFNPSKHKSGRASTEHLCTWSSPRTFTGSFVPNSKTEVPELPMSPTLVRLFFLFYTSYPPGCGCSSILPCFIPHPLLCLRHGPSPLDWLYLLSQRGAVGIQSVSLSQASFPLISLDYRLLKGRACDWLSLYTHTWGRRVSWWMLREVLANAVAGYKKNWV